MQTPVGIRAFLYQTSIRLSLGSDCHVMPTKLGIHICPCRDRRRRGWPSLWQRRPRYPASPAKRGREKPRAARSSLGAARDKLTLSEQNALEVFRMAEGYIACRRALEQITRNGSRNVGMALQACRFRHAASGIERIAR